MRAELDQTPAWWDARYRALVAETFVTPPFDPADHEGHDVDEIRTWSGDAITATCLDCPPPRPIPRTG